MDDGTGRVDHEVCHGALARLLEAVDVVRDAHLVSSSLAVSAWKMVNILASLKAYNMQSVAGLMTCTRDRGRSARRRRGRRWRLRDGRRRPRRGQPRCRKTRGPESPGAERTRRRLDRDGNYISVATVLNFDDTYFDKRVEEGNVYVA